MKLSFYVILCALICNFEPVSAAEERAYIADTPYDLIESIFTTAGVESDVERWKVEEIVSGVLKHPDTTSNSILFAATVLSDFPQYVLLATQFFEAAVIHYTATIAEILSAVIGLKILYPHPENDREHIQLMLDAVKSLQIDRGAVESHLRCLQITKSQYKVSRFIKGCNDNPSSDIDGLEANIRLLEGLLSRYP